MEIRYPSPIFSFNNYQVFVLFPDPIPAGVILKQIQDIMSFYQ